jgi:serine/threonine-protein kinase HipA
VLRKYAAFPLGEIQKLLRWIAFNVCVGNADAHGKNLSLLYHSTAGVTLAPFYDLVCTRNYPRISRMLAMLVGGQADPDLVSERHWRELATNLNVGFPALLKALREIAEPMGETLKEVAERFGQRHGDSPILERLPPLIQKLTHGVLRRLNQK